MANLDFYALGEDLRRLFQFLYSETDVVVYESASEPDREARRFTSLEELEAVFNLETSRSVHLNLWSPSIMERPVMRRVELKVPGHSFRYAVEGAGLIQLYLDGNRDGTIYPTHYGHWNEAGARERSMHPARDCDWKALSKISGSIQRYIRNKLVVARLHSRPVLTQAFVAVQQGYGLWWGPTVHHIDSPELQPLLPKPKRGSGK